MKLIWFKLVLPTIILNLISIVYSQINTNIVLIDKKYENEPYYYDLSYLNSNFNNYESIQNKYSTRDRNGMPNNKHSCNQVKQIPSNIRNDMKLSYFYQKYTEAYGIPVIGSNKVSSNGLKRACYVLRYFLSSSFEIKETFYKRNLRIVVLATSENLLSVPEYSSLPIGWNSIRGLSPTVQIPIITVAEENILCSNDKHKAEDLLLHEFSYALVTLDALNSNLKGKLDNYYERAKLSVPWSSTFSLADHKEYLASGIDVYLNALGRKDQVNFSLEDLKRYDPSLLSLVQEIFPCDNQYLTKCKSSRESESSQVLKQDKYCESEVSQVTQILKASTNAIYPEIDRSFYTTKEITTTTTPTITTAKTTTSTQSNPRRLITTGNPRENTVYTTDYNFYNIMKAFNRQTATQPSSTTTATSISTRITSSSSTTTTTEQQKNCENINENCESWAAKGECNRNRQFMNIECKKSCNFCNEKTTKTTRRTTQTTRVDLAVFENLCKDEYAHCPVFALRGDCKTNPHHMLDKCKRSCNLCGDLVQQKDRIQPTSKKTPIRRPNVFNQYRPQQEDNSNFFNFIDYNPTTTIIETTTTQIPTTTTTLTTTKALYYTWRPSTTQNRYQRPTEPAKTTEATTEESKLSCKDLVAHCPELAERGDCVSNEATMQYYCSKSCKFC